MSLYIFIITKRDSTRSVVQRGAHLSFVTIHIYNILLLLNMVRDRTITEYTVPFNTLRKDISPMDFLCIYPPISYIVYPSVLSMANVIITKLYDNVRTNFEDF